MVCKALLTEKLGFKRVLRWKIFPNDKYFISTLFIWENHGDNVINTSSRLSIMSESLLQQWELFGSEHVFKEHIQCSVDL